MVSREEEENTRKRTLGGGGGELNTEQRSLGSECGKREVCECDTLIFKGRIWPHHHKASIVEVASKWRRWEP